MQILSSLLFLAGALTLVLYALNGKMLTLISAIILLLLGVVLQKYKGSQKGQN